VVQTEGPQMTSQYDAYALRAGLARLNRLMRMHTPTRPGTHMHARTHARARKLTQTNKQYLLLFHGNNNSRKMDVTLCVHCLSCLNFKQRMPYMNRQIVTVIFVTGACTSHVELSSILQLPERLRKLLLTWKINTYNIF
jgi:hypothetical protein